MSQCCINMYNHNDILIVGDSFAQDRTNPTDWPMALSKMLTGSDAVPNGIGKGGTAWWTARRSIIKALQENPPKVLIVCHTEANRLPSDKDVGINSGTVLREEYDPKNTYWYSKEEYIAAQMYYIHLMSEEFHAWARTHWFYELDHISASIPIVIHLHCFYDYELKEHGLLVDSYTFRHGITSSEILFKLQAQESPLPNGRDLPGFRNHFSPENNVKIAQALYKAIIGFDPVKNGTKQYLDLLGQGVK
jgi:hypothetical protein